MEFVLKFEEFQKNLQGISKSLEGELNCEDGWREISFYNTKLRGSCRGFNVDHGFEAYYFDLHVQEDLRIKVHSGSSSPVNLIYCLENILFQHFPNESYHTTLGFRQNVILRDTTSRHYYLDVVKGSKVKFSLIALNPDSYPYPSGKKEYSLRDAFMFELQDRAQEMPRRYLGRINPEASSHVETLAEPLGNRSSIFYEAALNKVVVSQLRQFQLDTLGAHRNAPLKLYDLDKVLAVSDFIRDNLAEELTVGRLQNLTGLNPTKLQAGFRYLFEKSVNTYITDNRLDRALQLLQETDLTISEIVYSVGFNSRSYFTKIFKKRFKILPSECGSKHIPGISIHA